jgi:hypothetical protein
MALTQPALESPEEQSSIPTSIDAMALTTASWITLTRIAFPISCGYSVRDVARRLGQPQKWVTERLDELRDELQEQARKPYKRNN